MTVVRSSSGDNIIANIRDITGSMVAVGKYILQISIHGGLVNIVLPRQRTRVRPRPLPVDWRTAPAPDLLDRQTEVSQATAALRSGQPLEFYGRAGIGKTTLLDYLAYHCPTPSCPHGVVPLRGSSVDDLLQSLFNAFYESDPLLKPSDIQIREYLHDKKALILLDDLDLKRDQLETLMRRAPNCTFLIASSERHLWRNGHAVALAGLPLEHALALVERELGRSLTSVERPIARDICLTLDGNPWYLIQALALVREEGYSLASMPATELAGRILASRSEPERRMLAVLAALGGAPITTEHLTALTGLPEATSILDNLLQRGLMRAEGSHIRLTGDLGQVLQSEEQDLTPLQEQALAHFITWAEQHQHNPKRLIEDAEAIVQILGWATRTGRWSQALRLVRAVEGVFALSGHWGVWGHVLEQGLDSARVMENQEAAEAWALHQLGTRALCLGDITDARSSLIKALRLRERLGDEGGAAVTRHNLEILLGPTRRTEQRKEESPKSRPHPSTEVPRKPKVPFPIGWPEIVLSILILALGGLAAWLILPSLPPPTPVVEVTETPTPTNTPTPLPPPAISITPDRLDFGKQLVGTSSAAKTLTLANSGVGLLTIDNVTPIEPDAGDFIKLADYCTGSNLGPENSCTINIGFVPQMEGNRSITLNIVSNGPDGPYQVLLSGIGTSPRAGLSPDGLEFGPQQVGTSSAAQTVILSNIGSAPLTVDAVTFVGDNPEEFTMTHECSGISLDPGDECTIEVTFGPTVPGNRSAHLSISNGAPDSPQSVSLSGVAEGVPHLDLIPTSLEFEPQEINTESAAQTVTLSNIGSASLTISNVGITGENTGDFVKTDNCIGASLDPGDNCMIEVTFAPVDSGRRSASLTITDVGANITRDVPLGGTGVGVPRLRVTPTSLDFEPQEMDTSSTPQMVTLLNIGSASVIINNIVLTGNNLEDFAETDDCIGPSLNPGNSCTISVTFAPTAPGNRSAGLIINNNTTDSPWSVPLRGTGIGVPLAHLNPNSVEFEPQPLNTSSAARMITLSSVGSAPLTVNAVTLVGDNSEDFIETHNCAGVGVSLDPGSSCTIRVIFTPTAPGSRRARLNITDNAADSLEVPLSGLGVSRGPDLIITTFEATGRATRNQQGSIEVPVRVVVKNQGSTAAGIFKVATAYTGPSGTFVVPFTVPGQNSIWYPFTTASLSAGAEVTFAGTVTFGSALQGQLRVVLLSATADSCSSDEFMPDYCRVEESDEENNEATTSVLLLLGPVMPPPGEVAPTKTPGPVVE